MQTDPKSVRDTTIIPGEVFEVLQLLLQPALGTAHLWPARSRTRKQRQSRVRSMRGALGPTVLAMVLDSEARAPCRNKVCHSKTVSATSNAYLGNTIARRSAHVPPTSNTGRLSTHRIVVYHNSHLHIVSHLRRRRLRSEAAKQ